MHGDMLQLRLWRSLMKIACNGSVAQTGRALFLIAMFMEQIGPEV